MQADPVFLERVNNGEEPILLNDHPVLRKLHRSTVIRWVLAGKLPAVRIGKKFFTLPSLISECILSGALSGPAANPPTSASHQAAMERLQLREKRNA
jgi:hypothetical protein